MQRVLDEKDALNAENIRCFTAKFAAQNDDIWQSICLVLNSVTTV